MPARGTKVLVATERGSAAVYYGVEHAFLLGTERVGMSKLRTADTHDICQLGPLSLGACGRRRRHTVL